MALTQIGASTKEVQQTPSNSSPQQALEVKDKNNTLVTPQEARERGLHFRHSPPEPGQCEYCGKPLVPKGVALGGAVIAWQPTLPRCDCEQAQAYWKEQDRQEAERKAAKREEQRRKAVQERIVKLFEESGIKKRFQQRTFANFRCDTQERIRSYKLAKDYADNFAYHYERGDGLYIEGTNGTGKTHLAVAIALQLIGEGIPVICKTSGKLLQDIKKSFDFGKVQEYEILDAYKQADLLIIDDLGKEQCTDWGVSTLYSILNERYEDMKPTIVTTNYNTEGLARALTPKGMDNSKVVAIISRLRETSTVMTMAWEDWRSGGQKGARP